LDWLGIELDDAANRKCALRISALASKVGCYVIPTDEEQMIARHTWRVIAEHAGSNVREMRA
jgi:acetate kinase